MFKPDLLVYDFDGVMTDNRVLVMQDGTEAVFVNSANLRHAIADHYGVHAKTLMRETV